MTIDEIEAEFESEWVLVEDPETDEQLRVLGGTVRCHSRHRDDVYQAAIDLRLKRDAVLYTGRIPEGAAVIL